MTQHCALCGHELPDAPQLSIVGSPVDATRKSRSRDPDTSKNAARLAVVRQGSQRFKLLSAFAAAGPSGLTAEAAADRTGLIYVAASTRCTELVRGGLVERTGHTRPTSSGTPADLLVVTDAGRDELLRVRVEAA
jgi:hypothetical protein